jgi:hypothetical protein
MPKTIDRPKKPEEKKPRKNARDAVAIPEIVVVTEGPVCAHHWVIAAPNGETSTGRCKVCGLEKEFPNSADDYLWERSVPQSRWTGRADSGNSGSGF